MFKGLKNMVAKGAKEVANALGDAGETVAKAVGLRVPASQEQLEKWSTELRKSMKGLGTDEKALIEVLVEVHPDDMPALAKTYQAKIDRDLKKDVDSEIGGNFRDVARLLMMSNADLDATLVHKAIKGIGTNEQLLIEVLCTRSGDDMKAMKESYERLFEHAMLKDVKDDTSGEFKSTLVALIESKRETPKDEQVAEDVEKLYQAGENKVGTKQSEFYRVLCGYNHKYVCKVNEMYGDKHGKALVKVIGSEFSGDSSKALQACAHPAAEYFAAELKESMKGVGTNDEKLIRLIVSIRARWMHDTKNVFLRENKKSLEEWVKSETSGDYKKCMTSIIKKWSNEKE